MKQLVGMVAILVLASMGMVAPLDAARARQDAPKTEPDKITVRALVIPSARKNLVLGGEARLKEGTLLKVAIAKIGDNYAWGSGEIKKSSPTPFPRYVPVTRKKFKLEFPGTKVWGPGLYKVTIETVRDGGKTKITKDVACWPESFTRKFDDTLKEFDELADETIRSIQAVNQAASLGPQAFKAAAAVVKKMSTHLKKINKSQGSKVFQIAIGLVTGPLVNVIAQAEKFKWDARGKFVGPNDYYGPGESSYGGEFSFPNEIDNVRKAYEIAGREFSLWVIRDFRRKGALTPSMVNAVRKHAEHVGVIEYAARLENLTLENVDAVEKAVRRVGEIEEPKAKEPVPPPKSK